MTILKDLERQFSGWYLNRWLINKDREPYAYEYKGIVYSLGDDHPIGQWSNGIYANLYGEPILIGTGEEKKQLKPIRRLPPKPRRSDRPKQLSVVVLTKLRKS